MRVQQSTNATTGAHLNASRKPPLLYVSVDLHAPGALTISMLTVSNYCGRLIEAECQKL